jgi:hypothetical protein
MNLKQLNELVVPPRDVFGLKTHNNIEQFSPILFSD